MKVITPKFLESLALGDPIMKVTRTKVSFNKAACELLALRNNAKFVIEDEGNGLLYYKDTASADSFTIENTYKYGGSYAHHQNLLSYLGGKDAKELSYLIGELKDGRRVLMLKKRNINK